MRHRALLAAGAGGGAWTPATASPVMWVDASDAATITSSGGAVSAWSNKGSLGGSFDQSTAGSKPTTGTRTQNSLNVLDFDGGDSLVSSLAASSWVPLHDGTLWVVGLVAARDVAGVNGGILSAGTAAGSTGTQLRWLSSNNLSHFVNNASAVAVTNLAYGMGTSTAGRVITELLDPGNATAIDRARLYVDAATDVAINSASGTPSSSDPGSTLVIGNRATNPVPLDGWIGEIVILTGVNATEANRGLLHTYLNTKWAVY